MWEKIKKIISMYEEDRKRFRTLEDAMWILSPWTHEDIIEWNNPIEVAKLLLDEKTIWWVDYYLWEIDDKWPWVCEWEDWTKIIMRYWDLDSLKKALEKDWLL